MAWYDDVWDFFSGGSDSSFDIANPELYYGNPELDEPSNLTSYDWEALRDAGFTTSDLESWGLSDPTALGQIGRFFRTVGGDAVNAIKGAFTKEGGGTDWRAIATAGGALLPLLTGGSSAPRPTGYQGGIPELTAVRQAVPQTYDPNRRPGSGGQRYFTDVQYVPKTGDTAPEALAAAQTAASEQASGLVALNQQNLANEYKTVKAMARGGIVGLQDGGFVVPADVVSHLGNGSSRAGLAHLQKRGAVPIQGRGDGMSDSNRTMINNRQPAAVADGEAYLPPDKVQRMGGPERLYSMMDRIRKDRTGTTQQGRQINPNKYLG